MNHVEPAAQRPQLQQVGLQLRRGDAGARDQRVQAHRVVAHGVEQRVASFLFGLAVPAGWLKTLIVPLTFLMVYPMMVSLKPGASL